MRITLTVLPVNEINGYKWGNKVVLPLTVLNTMNNSNEHIDIMCFSIDNEFFVGVHDFSSNTNIIEIPSWLCEQYNLMYGSRVTVESVQVKKATKLDIIPQDDVFLHFRDPKTILEKNLNNHTHLWNNEEIKFDYLNRIFKFTVKKIHINDTNDKNQYYSSESEFDSDYEYDNEIYINNNVGCIMNTDLILSFDCK